MSAAVWPFAFLRRGFREYLATSTAVHAQGGGRRVTQRLHATGELVVRGTVLFPNAGGTYQDLAAFWFDRGGAFESFLYKCQDVGGAAASDVEAAAAGQTDFGATRRYVDTATLVVRKAGVVQTLGAHYTIENEAGAAYVLGTSKQLVVAFAAAPGAGVQVQLDYEFYYPVRFEGDDLLDDQDLIGGGVGAATVADRTVGVELREAGAGYSYADTPNVL